MGSSESKIEIVSDNNTFFVDSHTFSVFEVSRGGKVCGVVDLILNDFH